VIDETAQGGPYLRKEVVVTDDRTGRVEADVDERVRLYTPDAMEDLLARGGFSLLGPRYGDLDERPWTPEAPRFVRVGERATKSPVSFHSAAPRPA
jgi:hypothetical protein